ncbi:hypothetical protein O181_023748 [Austropuccinia psidii MF-1]|uniref:Uncharacterized protein n=1 Tax=Austropuccinia psidii MF-1 TaxID=1389203 RepID=A0A9Q3CJE4_9BASI|nr:hypothetical protein [Austropuccinia psidii MF-1]
MNDYALKHKYFKNPILVSVRPTVWEKIKVQTLDDVKISIKATVAKGHDKGGSSTDVVFSGSSKFSQSRDLRAVIDLLDDFLNTPNKCFSMAMVIGRMHIIKKALRTLAEDLDISAITSLK